MVYGILYLKQEEEPPGKQSANKKKYVQLAKVNVKDKKKLLFELKLFFLSLKYT